MKEITKHYSNGEVTITWKAHLCSHSGNCSRGLLPVFDPRRRPWIDPALASTQQIIDQVSKCPSGALTTKMNSGENNK